MPLSDQLQVLVVDDHVTSRMLTVEALQQLNIKNIHIAKNGKEGFTKSVSANVHLVLSDLYMPEVDGLQLLHAIRSYKTTAKLAVIIITGSHDENVWHNVNRMLTLNGEQSRRGLEQHICPLQFDIVDRLIERFSNAGDLVHDPFCGLGTVPLRAIKKGRKGSGSELSTSYWADSVKHLQAAERELSMPTLFDSLEQDKAA